MACPYFLPTEKFEQGGWPHPPRLPLGAGWRGLCTAPGHEKIIPSDEELREFCNIGYAKDCKRIPDERKCDAVRFAVTRDRDQRIQVCYVCEVQHHPGTHGFLEYDFANNEWAIAHPDARVQAMAACYVESYLERRPSAPASPAS